MPTAALHSHYWAGARSSDAPVTAGASGAGGYVPWQTTVIIGGGLGSAQIVWDWLMVRLKERSRGDV